MIKRMKVLRVGLVSAMWVAGVVAGAQVPASAPTSQSAAPSADAAHTRLYDTLQPSMVMLQQTLDTLRVDKWKAANPVKDAATNNIVSIRRDVRDTLPPLMRAADAAPGSVSALLAVTQNVNALYDVVLRVDDTAELTAPQGQTADLAQVLSGLLVARRAVGDMLRDAVSAQDQKVADLRKSLNDKTAAAAVVPPPCPPAAPAKPAAKKKAAVKKPAMAQ